MPADTQKRHRKQAKRIKVYEAGREKGYNDNRIFREILKNEKCAGEKTDTMNVMPLVFQGWYPVLLENGMTGEAVNTSPA